MKVIYIAEIFIIVSCIFHVQSETIDIDILDLKSSLKSFDDALEEIRNNQNIPPHQKFLYGSVLYENYLRTLQEIATQRKKENDLKMENESKTKNQQDKQNILRQNVYKSILAKGKSSFHNDFHTLRY
jgi:hypothetical protein